LCLAFTATYVVACSDSPTAPALVPTSITISPPAATLDAFGATQSFQAVVRDQNGDVIPSASVQWTTQSASVASISQQGQATAEGNGTTQVTARSGNAQVSVTLAVQQQVHTIAKLTGDNQQGIVGSQLSLPLSVRLRDRLGNPIAGVLVQFSLPAGAGSLSANSAMTDASGTATTFWTLGTVPAQALAVNASAGGTVPAESFTAVALVGAPAIIRRTAGDGQVAPAGSVLPVAPTVLVLDQFENPVEGAIVSFEVVGGGGSRSGSPAVTNSQGAATLGSWTLGPAAGANSLSAEVAGVAATVFAATGTVVPTALDVHAGDGQIATVATTLPVAAAVRVTGAGAVPVPGVTVTFSVAGGGGSINGASAVTDANGVATVGSWTLGTVAGANALRASFGELAPVNFMATGVAGAPSGIFVNGGQNGSATAGTALPVAPSVLVRDAFANPVSGASVIFAVTSGGGSVTGSPAVSNALGIATLGSWTMGTAPGTNTLSAQVAGVAAISFSAQAILTPTTISIHAGNGQLATVGTQLPIAPAVRVTGAGGLPVPGIIVTFSVGLGGGMITGLNVFTDANGVAATGSWTLGTTIGNNTLIVNAASLTAVTIRSPGGLACRAASRGGRASRIPAPPN
jgi:adhesin/invasin